MKTKSQRLKTIEITVSGTYGSNFVFEQQESLMMTCN